MEIKVRKLFFAWGMDKEKVWLESMAKEGWVLKSVGFGNYTFLKSDPQDLVYEFDFHILSKEKEEEYLSYFEDWTLVSRYGGWYYFYSERKEDLDLSIFNNNESRIKMLKRLMIFLIIVAFPIYYQVFFMFPIMTASELAFPHFYFFFRIIMILFLLLHSFAMIKLVINYRRLLKSIKQ